MSMIDTALMKGLERMLDLSTFRQQVFASNLANVDTPGYRTRDVRTFAGAFDAALAENDAAPPTPVARPVYGLLERPDGNNVSVERESLLMAQNQLRFEVAVQFLRAEFRKLSIAINEGKTS